MATIRAFLSIVLYSGILFTSILCAQDSTNFFPHQIGDMWEYYFSDLIDDDTMQVVVIKDSVDQDGNHHVVRAARSINPVAPPIFFFRDTTEYVIDTLNQVLTKFSFGTVPLPIFKLDAQKGDQWVLWDNQSFYEMVRVGRVYRDILFKDSTTFKAYIHYAAPDSADTTGLVRNQYTLADGFGIVYGFGEPGLYMGLTGAVINNVLYGDTTLVSVHSALANPIPEQFQLYQNYPNPFNSTTFIPFHLQRSGLVSLLIYDVTGRLVRKVIDRQRYLPGDYEVVWDGNTGKGGGAASGMYFYQLIIGQHQTIRPMLLIR